MAEHRVPSLLNPEGLSCQQSLTMCFSQIEAGKGSEPGLGSPKCVSAWTCSFAARTMDFAVEIGALLCLASSKALAACSAPPGLVLQAALSLGRTLQLST